MDVAQFRLKFPFFADATFWPDDVILAQVDTAQCYLLTCDCPCSDLALMLMVAHLLIINGSGTMPGVGAVGVVTSASVGGVSVGLTVQSADKSSLSAWLGKTPYGEQLLALMRALSGGVSYYGGSPERRGFRKIGGF